MTSESLSDDKGNTRDDRFRPPRSIIPHDVMLRELLELSKYTAWCCGFANRREDGSIIKTARNFHLDHINPRSKSGSHQIPNRAPLCPHHNTSKGNKRIHLEEYRQQTAAAGELAVSGIENLVDLTRATQRAYDIYADAKNPPNDIVNITFPKDESASVLTRMTWAKTTSLLDEVLWRDLSGAEWESESRSEGVERAVTQHPGYTLHDKLLETAIRYRNCRSINVALTRPECKALIDCLLYAIDLRVQNHQRWDNLILCYMNIIVRVDLTSIGANPGEREVNTQSRNWFRGIGSYHERYRHRISRPSNG